MQGLRTQMAHSQTSNGSYDWGDITLWFDHSKDIGDLDFITYLGTFGKSTGEMIWAGQDPQNQVPWKLFPLSHWNNSNFEPYLPQQLDGFTKSFYSYIIADLGQTLKPNILTDPKLLQYYLAAEFDTNRTTDAIGIYNMSTVWHPDPVPIAQAYDVLNTTKNMGQLGAKPAQINTQYACQVPQLNGTGTLTMTVIIGDLVLLQALWTAFCWFADLWLRRLDPTASFCDGCAKQQTMRKTPYGLTRAISWFSSSSRSNTASSTSSTKTLAEDVTTVKEKAVDV